MVDYYEIVGVRFGCSRQEIKKGFRRKAKQIHPDVASGAPGADERMKRLLKAYETLMDPDSRREYDERYSYRNGGRRFDYREFLKLRKNDPESQAKLIFFDLLHGNEDEAVELYERLTGESSFRLENFLGREDYMDCAFILAEEFEKREQYVLSYGLLRTIVEFEYRRPYFRHFFEEVVARLRILACLKMPGKTPPDLLLGILSELIRFDFCKKDTIRFMRKSAEIFRENVHGVHI